MEKPTMEQLVENLGWKFSLANVILEDKLSMAECLELFEKCRYEDVESVGTAIILQVQNEPNQFNLICKHFIKVILARDVVGTFGRVLWDHYTECIEGLTQAINDDIYPKHCLMILMEEAQDSDVMSLLQIVKDKETQNSSTRFFKFILSSLDF